MAKRIIFDVGANWGTDSLEETAQNPDIVCHAFEPTLELIQHLYSKSWAFADRYRIHPVAVSDFDGKATFHIAPQGDWGTSSLNEFQDNLAETWPGRPDLFSPRAVEVAVYRFETLFRQGALPVAEIDFFHCDTQGSDLKVLEGMGDFVCLIKKGCIEVPINESVKLYKNQHSREQAEQFLSAKGFHIYDVTHQMNEQNLYFERR